MLKIVVIFALFSQLFFLSLFFGSSDISAAVYYISPSGNDSNPGTAASPWRTINKANSAAGNGDTIILKDGVYPGYFGITKSGTTWKAENPHKAIIDGGFTPASLGGEWKNIVRAWDTACKNVGQYRPLLAITVDNVTVDGVFLRNSCGRGLLLWEKADKVILKNNRIDWTFINGIRIGPDVTNSQLISNIFTRTGMDDQYALYSGDGYRVNAMMFGGKGMIVRGNIIAWSRGEIATPGARNLVFEGNIVVGNKNNLYPGPSDGVIVRNNLFYNPESELNPGTHWERVGGLRSTWRMVTRSEGGGIADRFGPYAYDLRNIAYYNNLIVNSRVAFDGFHNNAGHQSNTTNVYFGHNTIIAGSQTEALLRIAFSGGNNSPVFTALFENNIFDVRKNPSTRFGVGLDNNDKVVFRNNIWPTNVTGNVRGPGDVYTNNPGLVNAVKRLDFPIPGIGVENVDISGLIGALTLTDYLLTQNSPAIDKGSTAGSPNGTTIPELARKEDLSRFPRTAIPDIGAFEYGSTGVFPIDFPDASFDDGDDPTTGPLPQLPFVDAKTPGWLTYMQRYVQSVTNRRVDDKGGRKNVVYCNQAGTPSDTPEDGNERLYTALGCVPVGTTGQFITFLLNRSLAIGGGFTFLLSIYASLMYMTSAGDPKKVQGAKDLFTASISGLTLIILGIFFLRLVAQGILNLPAL